MSFVNQEIHPDVLIGMNLVLNTKFISKPLRKLLECINKTASKPHFQVRANAAFNAAVALATELPEKNNKTEI